MIDPRSLSLSTDVWSMSSEDKLLPLMVPPHFNKGQQESGISIAGQEKSQHTQKKDVTIPSY